MTKAPKSSIERERERERERELYSYENPLGPHSEPIYS